MNSILKIYVPSTLTVAAQLTEVLTVTLDLTPDISKQPTLHDQVHYSLRIKSSYKYISREIYYSINKSHNNKSHDGPIQYVLTLKTYQLKVTTSMIKTNHLN